MADPGKQRAAGSDKKAENPAGQHAGDHVRHRRRGVGVRKLGALVI